MVRPMAEMPVSKVVESVVSPAHVVSMTGRRRYATVLFTDVSDSSRHAELMEAEEYAHVLEQFRRVAREVVAKHGGEIARMQGDGLLALFGHLFPQEDDGRRAVEAALSLHELAGGISLPLGADTATLQLHSGVHSGLVLLLEGDIERGRFDVVGEVPNTASRLSDCGAAGEIWVSETSLGPHAHFFDATRVRRTAIRGRSEPLNALRISGRLGIDRRLHAAARRGAVSLIGRERELAVLQASADQVRNGQGARWMVNGEPGIGKSRLLEALRRQLEAAGFWVIHGSYERALAAQPLHAFATGLRALVGCSPDGSATGNEAAARRFLQVLNAHALADSTLPVRLAGNAQPIESLRVEDIVDALAAVASHGPTALLLDDWQWADDASHQVLQRLDQTGLPVFVLEGVRTPLPDGAAHGKQVLTLDPLPHVAVEELIAAWIPHADPFTAAEIERSAGGNPLFVEELCCAANVGVQLPIRKIGTGIAWLNALVASRLSALQPGELDCLQLAAVADHAATPELLATIGDISHMASHIDALLAKDFLVPARRGDAQNSLHFKHALTRDAVYATIEATRRRELHGRVAHSLEAAARDDETADHLEALAHHYHSAREDAKAAYFAEAAGDRASALLASDRARAHYTVALEALSAMALETDAHRRRWCLVAQKLGGSCVFDPLAVTERLALFRRALKLAHEIQDVDLIARAEYWLGYIDYGRGHPKSAIRHCEAALSQAQASGEPRLIAQVQATLGQALAQAGRYGRAQLLLTQAVESKRHQSHPGSRVAIGSAYTLSRMAYVLGDLGRFEQASACFGQAVALVGDAPHPVGGSIYTTVSAVHLWQGRWVEAAAAAERGVDIALRCRSHYLVAMGRALLGCAQWAAWSDPTVLNGLRQTCREIEAHGGAAWMSLIYAWLVEGNCALGDLVSARSEAVRLLLRARVEDFHGLAMGYRALARFALEQGEPALAARYLARADAAASARASPREAALNDHVRALLRLQHGQLQEGTAMEEASRDALRRMNVVAAPGLDLDPVHRHP